MHPPDSRLDEITVTTSNFSQGSNFAAEIRTQHLTSTRLQPYFFASLLGPRRAWFLDAIMSMNSM
jgi:hypothetical protein